MIGYKKIILFFTGVVAVCGLVLGVWLGLRQHTVPLAETDENNSVAVAITLIDREPNLSAEDRYAEVRGVLFAPVLAEADAASSADSALIIDSKAASNISPEILLADFCREHSTGWSCQGLAQANAEANYLADNLANLCQAAGGRYTCEDGCFPQGQSYCDLPWQDAGAPCSVSDQCDADCAIGADEIKQRLPDWRAGQARPIECPGCQGQCTEYTMRECDWSREDLYELSDGMIVEYGRESCR